MKVMGLFTRVIITLSTSIWIFMDWLCWDIVLLKVLTIWLSKDGSGIHTYMQQNKDLAMSNVHCYFKFFPGVLGYNYSGNNIVTCHKIVTFLDVPHCFIVSTIPVP